MRRFLKPNHAVEAIHHLAAEAAVEDAILTAAQAVNPIPAAKIIDPPSKEVSLTCSGHSFGSCRTPQDNPPSWIIGVVPPYTHSILVAEDRDEQQQSPHFRHILVTGVELAFCSAPAS